MRLPERLSVARALLRQELHGLLAARPLWVMLLALAPLVGYGFIQALSLYAEASRSAVGFPELARGLTPLDGVIVPTFGAFYLAVTLLFPFVAIRTIAEEKRSGAIKLVQQFPVTIGTMLALKALAVGLIWCLSLVPALTAIAAWTLLGGHVYWPELANLLLGYALYALAVTGIAFFAAAVADSAATAAIIALAGTLGFWVLDFAAASAPTDGLLQALSLVSLTAGLRQFEHGLFSLSHALALALLGVGLIVGAAAWLRADQPLRRRLVSCAVLAWLLAGLLTAAGQVSFYRDASEDRRNSFNPADEAALAHMDKGLTITLYLAPEDSRLMEMETNVLAKLRRLVPKLRIRYGEIGRRRLFGAAGGDNYGLVVYEYDGRRDASRSNSPREILPLLHALAGVEVKPVELPPYPGYPLIAHPAPLGWWFYVSLPGLIVGAWWWLRRPRRFFLPEEG